MVRPKRPGSPPEQQGFWRRSWAWARPRRWWITLGVFFTLVWWLVPPLLYRYTGTDKAAKLKAITDTRTALLAGLLGVGALLTFWLNSRVYRITAETLRVTEQGQITDRYTKAIEQLGSDRHDVRLGGIYALERIAVDSPRDHATVVEVLGAFVREHSEHSDPQIRALSTTEVEAAATVLGRLPDRLPNLSRGDLRWANLGRAGLKGANLRKANLAGANLWMADLTSANLVEADLFGANLKNAKLGDANLERANLEGAEFSEGTNLNGTNLAGATLKGVDLLEVDLTTVRGLTWGQLDNSVLYNPATLPPELRKSYGIDGRRSDAE
jgi:Pentapeptide repeats (8 copies)